MVPVFYFCSAGVNAAKIFSKRAGKLLREFSAFAMYECGSNLRKIIVAGKIFGRSSGKIIRGNMKIIVAKILRCSCSVRGRFFLWDEIMGVRKVVEENINHCLLARSLA